ncbi:DUF2806 domain-containing protein [Brevundimonas sp.]|uniref:DUF2806 domain-containing protein n=1 Tax=Brevundimonas sp. TaxID=1871086 RepID=UPI0035B1EBAF
MSRPDDDGKGLVEAATEQGLAFVSGVPAGLQRSAKRVFGRLLGRWVAVPNARARAEAQKIDDETAARSLVMQKIVEAAALKAAADPTLVDRALNNFLADTLRRQENKDAITQTAEELLSQNQPEQSEIDPGDPDPDWLNVFEAHAERASGENLRLLWGKILAGEIRRPGSFSLSTLRFLSELDHSLAKKFNKYALFIEGDMMYIPKKKDQTSIREIAELEEAGLVVGASAGYSNTLQSPGGELKFRRGSCIVFIKTSGQESFKASGLMVTRVTKEIKSLVTSDDEMWCRNFEAALDATVVRVELIKANGAVEVLRGK